MIIADRLNPGLIRQHRMGMVLQVDELDQEHRQAIANYMRAEQVLGVQQTGDPASIELLVAKRDAALRELNLIRDVLLERVRRP